MAIPLLFPAAVLVLGAAVGYTIRDNEAKDVSDRDADFDTAVHQKVVALGMSLLNGRIKPTTKEEMSTYLRETYRGLYCIGRAGGKLGDVQIRSHLDDLANIHHLLRPQYDSKLVHWYRLGEGGDTALFELIGNCTEVKHLGVDARFIAYALGEASENLDFGGLTDEFVEGFAT